MMQERKSVLELPVKVLLSEEGAAFFERKGRNVRTFAAPDGGVERGLALGSFSPASLQRMMLIDYVLRLELSKTEIMGSRQEVMDLSKLVVYSMLYRQYDAAVMERLLAGEAVRRWNRANPAAPIDARLSVDEAYLQAFLKDKERDIHAIKQEVLAPLYAYISRNSSLLPEEKNVQLLLSEKYLNNLRPLTWFILARFRGAEGYEHAVKELRATLAEHMERAKIAEYASLMIMELAANTENSNLKREAELLFKGAVDMHAVLFDPEARRQVMEALERRGELVHLSWTLGSRNAPPAERGRLLIELRDRQPPAGKGVAGSGAEGALPGSAGAGRVAAQRGNPSLEEYYRKLPGGEAGVELGLYYLSYLAEACGKVKAGLGTWVEPGEGGPSLVAIAIDL